MSETFSVGPELADAFSQHSEKLNPRQDETSEIIPTLNPLEYDAARLAEAQLDMELFDFDPQLGKLVKFEIEKQLASLNITSLASDSHVPTELFPQPDRVSIESRVETTLPSAELVETMAVELARMAVRGVQPNALHTNELEHEEIAYTGDFTRQDALHAAIRDQEVMMIAVWLLMKHGHSPAMFEAEAGSILRHINTHLNFEMVQDGQNMTDEYTSDDAMPPTVPQMITIEHTLRSEVSNLSIQIELGGDSDDVKEPYFNKQTEMGIAIGDTSAEKNNEF